MTKLTAFKYIYFIGIGGIGMSALARWFKAKGYEVVGYDKMPSNLTNALQEEQIAVYFDENIANIPKVFIENPSEVLVVYTPAVPKTHIEYQYFLQNHFTILKRSEVLGLITENFFTIAIAGTHGKTTTSAMVAHLLQTAKIPLTAFVGGITQNYETNILLSNGPNALIVVEADEYDRSFLTLSPNIVVITSTDADHLDIYDNHESVLESFRAFISKIKPDGILFFKKDISLNIDSKQIKSFSFGFEQKNEQQNKSENDEQANIVAQNVHIEQEDFYFDAQLPNGQKILDIRLQVAGYHNIMNSLAAISVGYALGISLEVIKTAISTFKGVKRRFEYVFKNKDFIQIDDYAHHPEEIKAFLTSVRALYPTKKITAIFQPHLYTRTRDFAEGFAESLSLADEVVLLPIYPARELPIEGINAEMLLQKITSKQKQVLEPPQIMAYLQNNFVEVILTIGAGNIDALVEPIQNLLSKKSVNFNAE